MLLAVLLITVLPGACGRDLEPLCDAVANEDDTKTAQLLEGGADPNIVCVYCIPPSQNCHEAPLHIAAFTGNVHTSEALLEHGAKIEAKDFDGDTPLRVAAKAGATAVVQALINHSARTNERNRRGETPLLYAEQGNHTAVVQMLVKPLHYAAWSGHKDVVQALLSDGAQVNEKDLDDMTPLHFAALGGHADVVQALLSHGAQINGKLHAGRTALHLAAKRGHRPVVELLVNNSADPLATDDGMDTPAELAISHNHTNVAEWLRTHGGATPRTTSLRSWVHAVRFHPREVATCAGVGVLLAGLKATVEWARSRKVMATPDSSPALVAELVPSMGALRLAARAISKDRRCGSLVGLRKLLAHCFAVIASLLFVCSCMMWLVKPLYIAAVAGPAFLVPALWSFGWQEVVNFPVLVIAAKTPAARCRLAVTILFLLVYTATLDYIGDARNGKLAGCLDWEDECGLRDHGVGLSFSVAGSAWQIGTSNNMMQVFRSLAFVLFWAALLWVLGVIAATSRCCCCRCRLPVVSRAAVEQLAREIDAAGAAAKLPQLHPELRPETLSGIVKTTGFAALDVLSDLNNIGTCLVTSNFWFAGVLWAVFLSSLGSELARGNIQALPGELRRTLRTGVMTARLIELLDTDKGFEAPFSLAITIYGIPFVAHDGNTFLMQCFSIFTSTVSVAGFLTNYLTLATLSDQPGEGEWEPLSSESADSETGTTSSESDTDS